MEEDVMGIFSRDRFDTAIRIINMTDTPICLYDSVTGEIVKFCPDMRRFSQKRPEELFPKDAHYVFLPEMTDAIKWFQEYCGKVAIIVRIDCGRGGAKIARLLSMDQKLVEFRPHEFRLSSR
jgi:hypothetical protein